MYNHRHVPFHYDDMATTQGFHKDERVPFYVVPEHNTVYYGQPNTAHGEVNRYFRELDPYFMPGNIGYFKGTEVFPGEWSPKEGLSPNYYAATKTSPELQQEIHNELSSLYGVPSDHIGHFFLETIATDWGSKLHKWVYGNGETHFGPAVKDMDDPPYHSNIVQYHWPGAIPRDVACGYYWPGDNSVHMYSRTEEAPERQNLEDIIRQEALAQDLTDEVPKEHEAAYKLSWWEASWIYDATDGTVYHGYDHVDIISHIPNWQEKAGEGKIVCGWYTTGNDPDVDPDQPGIGTPIRTDTVSGKLADKNSPYAQEAMKAAIADWHNSPEHIEVE